MSSNTFILLIPVNCKDSFFSQLDSDVYLFSSWGLPGEVRGRHTVCYAHKGHLVSFLSHLHRSRRVNHWLSWTGNENVMGKQSEQCCITLNTYSYTSVLLSTSTSKLLPIPTSNQNNTLHTGTDHCYYTLCIGIAVAVQCVVHSKSSWVSELYQA